MHIALLLLVSEHLYPFLRNVSHDLVLPLSDSLLQVFSTAERNRKWDAAVALEAWFGSKMREGLDRKQVMYAQYI